MIDKNRLLAITDGIIAIAATIMVLELNIPEKASFAAMAEQWPTLIAYIISFLQIFLAWHEHHDSMANAELINHRVFLLNCLWLFFVTMMPLATGIIGNHPGETFAVLLYIGVLFMVEVTITIETIAIQKLNHNVVLDGEIISLIRKVTLIGYVIAAAGALVMPIVGLLITLALSVVSIILICNYDSKLSHKL